MKNFYDIYKKNGFAVSKPLLDQDSIKKLRNNLDEELQDYQGGVILGIEKIKNQNLLKKIVEIFASSTIIDIVGNFENSINKDIFLLPKFQVHKNYHVNLKEFHGWHRDCSGEMSYKYCKNILFNKKYFFSKIGIYLQKNGEFGGSIDIIKNSHKNFSRIKTVLRKLKGIPLKIIILIHKYLNNLYLKVPEKIFMFFLNAKKLYPNEGSAVFFDSRIIHRGSPISKTKIKEVNYVKGEYHARLPSNKDKFTLYCQVGTSEAVDSYFFDRLKRENNSEELDVWIEQINIIKKIDQKFADKINLILDPIIKKYK